MKSVPGHGLLNAVVLLSSLKRYTGSFIVVEAVMNIKFMLSANDVNFKVQLDFYMILIKIRKNHSTHIN